MINGETRYGCSVCGKNYQRKTHVYRHIRIEHRGQKYICPHCTSTYKRKEDMKIHVQRYGRGSKQKFSLLFGDFLFNIRFSFMNNFKY